MAYSGNSPWNFPEEDCTEGRETRCPMFESIVCLLFKGAIDMDETNNTVFYRGFMQLPQTDQ
jgi:hypothetical protein